MAETPKTKSQMPLLFKKTRAGVPLSKEEINLIKQKRKELRKDLRKEGITSKKDFEVMASSLGYYFDKPRAGAVFAWLFSGRMLPLLLALMLATIGVVYGVSRITQLRGFFTVNLTEDLFKEGLSLRQQFSSGSKTSVLNLGEVGEEQIPNITFRDLPAELDVPEGNHSGENYFAYSFYIANEGEKDASYSYEIYFNSVTKDIDDALWLMLIVSDVDLEGNTSNTQMAFYAKPNGNGGSETLPWQENKYFSPSSDFVTYYKDMAIYPEQFVAVEDELFGIRYKFVPISFQSDTVVVSGEKHDVMPGYAQKFTVVIWLEGNDPDLCADYPGNSSERVTSYIGGSAGLGMKFKLLEEE